MQEIILRTTQELILKAGIEQATDFINEFGSKNSKRAYEGDMRYWYRWYDANELSIAYIRKEHIILFIMQHAEGFPMHVEKYLFDKGVKCKPGPSKIATIERRLATMSRYLEIRKLPNPCHDKDIRILLRKLTEKHGCSKAWGKAITLDVLNDMLNTCEDNLYGIRDKSLLLFGFATGGRRRSEIAEAVMENLSENADGTYIYNLTKSKTNKEGRDDKKPIVGRAAIALRHWLKVSKITQGPIFRGIYKFERGISKCGLEGRQIARIIKYRCERAGYNPNEYTAHSLRSGFVTEGGKRGKPIGDIMHLTGHRSLAEVMKYYQSGSVLNNSAAYLAG